ncbi:IS66 family transposase (plasmid) [Lichenicola cladoniae]|uniref:IS66 family transposase n=1 Tax=Lichenicola cladoniae TaxID=1484109 RepID=A0A6M8HZC5_9PROT|nr:IS66 family transposase [Lichenicola cladoniae]NPD66632.1 IS66 family transposase [Acetobacteraceae bacterium]QKE93742.1 IS66 family transposase [Lichenicola cladoniae]
MQIDLNALPEDAATLQQMLRTVLLQQGELHAENDKLRMLIQRLTRHQFGRRSEQLTPDQLQLALEELEQTIAANQAGQDAAVTATGLTRKSRIEPPGRNHGALPEHLPRYEVVVDVEDQTCSCCGHALHAIGELRTEQLDMVPSQLRVRVTRRPRYACRGCEGTVVVAPAPERPVDGGMPTEALIAHVVVSKFADSLPLYRQAQMLERQGIKLDRSTLANWVGRACWWLTPLYELMLGTVLAAPKLFAADTTLPVLDPGRGRTKTGRLWCYAVDDRPWVGPGHPMAAYVYLDDRKNERPAGHLARFRGVLQVDAYNGFKALASGRADASVTLAFCWSHMRRYFYEEYVSNTSPLAAELLLRVRSLYAIEAEIRGHPAGHRQTVRQERSRPIVEALHDWLHDQVTRISGASDLAKAMRYAIRHWPGLVVFLDDGRVEMDTKVVERAIRPNTLTRKNALFAGSDGGAKHWALAMTLIQTAKLNGVDPVAWLTDVLERIVSGRTKAHEMHTLLPWTWAEANASPETRPLAA